MGFLGFGKKKEVVDLGERYNRQQKRLAELKEGMLNSDEPTNLQKEYPREEKSSGGMFGFFNADSSSASETPTVYADSSSDDSTDKRKKLSKYLASITDKLEDLSNQIYHLQQRVELLERKAGVKGFV